MIVQDSGPSCGRSFPGDWARLERRCSQSPWAAPGLRQASYNRSVNDTEARRTPDQPHDDIGGARRPNVPPSTHPPMPATPESAPEKVAAPTPDPGAAPGGLFESWLSAPFLALQFLTIMPPVVSDAPRPHDLGRSEAFFPFVGLMLGAVLAVVDRLADPYVAPLVRDALLVVLLAVMTGALHLDGVIDTFDGLFVAGNRDRRLAIMRDPRAGAYGVVAIVLLLGLKVAALASLPAHLRFGSLLVAPCLGRWSIVLVTSQFPYARNEGMGQAFKQSLKWTHVVVAGAIAAEVAVLVLGVSGIAVWFAASTAALIVAHYVASRLGGLTGDTYGAICELVETGVLVALGLTIRGFG
jgi:adenosylcobinamide-GDP ribazoletransferase